MLKSIKLRVVWVLVGMGLAMLLSVEFMGSEQSVSAQVATAADPVFVGAGDIASCTSEGDEATANLLDAIPGTVYTTGDNVYESGTDSEFENCYVPSWGQFKARTMPSPGNHEYETPGASGYFNYFGAAAGDPSKGYYSYDLGEWHVISLNSNCAFVAGGCAAGSPQVQWLKNDLAAHSNACTLAYWHHPLFSSGPLSGGTSKMKPFWEALYTAKADVVLNGHVHNYERFFPQTPSGVADPAQGIREFVVGTGGRSLNTFKIDPLKNTEVRNADSYGVLKLTLHPSGYDWEFVPVAGKDFSDIGSDSCDPDTEPPTVESTSPATIAPTANVSATFSEAMDASTNDGDPSTINATTFKLLRLNADGTTTRVTAAVSYAAATEEAILNPSSDLSSGQTYKATVTTGAQDLAGNALDQNPNIAGNQPKSWKFKVQ